MTVINGVPVTVTGAGLWVPYATHTVVAEASYTFSVLPLRRFWKLLLYLASQDGATVRAVSLRFNGDSGTHYDSYCAKNDGTVLVQVNQTSMLVSDVRQVRGFVGEIIKAGYSNGAVAASIGAGDINSATYDGLIRGYWNTPADITSITVLFASSSFVGQMILAYNDF